ncbi:hypothetical protein [Ferrimonas sediminicola]|nr:hypothetical protein [Ferrimonas sediminicola]
MATRFSLDTRIDCNCPTGATGADFVGACATQLGGLVGSLRDSA